MSFTTEKTAFGWIAHGVCVLGPVHAHGMTEGMAQHNAQQKVREYLQSHFAEKQRQIRNRFSRHPTGEIQI